MIFTYPPCLQGQVAGMTAGFPFLRPDMMAGQMAFPGAMPTMFSPGAVNSVKSSPTSSAAAKR